MSHRHHTTGGARARSRHAFEKDPVAGRGFLGGIYRLPPHLALRAAKCAPTAAAREIAGLPVRVIDEDGVRYGRALSALEGVAFISYGYPFYTMWDQDGCAWITAGLADWLGFSRHDDDALAEIVVSGEDGGPEHRALQQWWLYWTVKRRCMFQRRSLTPTERVMQVACEEREIPFAEAFANIVILLHQVSRDPHSFFELAWNVYYDFPESEGCSLDHLTERERRRLSELRRQRMRGFDVLGDVERKKELIAACLNGLRQGDAFLMESLGSPPEQNAQMLLSFLTLLSLPELDRTVSSLYDEWLNGDSELSFTEAAAGWGLKDRLTTTQPVDTAAHLLRRDEHTGGRLLLIGAGAGWYSNIALRTTLGELQHRGDLDLLLTSDRLEESLLLFPEFDRSSLGFVPSSDGVAGHLRFRDAVVLDKRIRRPLANGQNVAIIVPIEEALKRPLHFAADECLFHRLGELSVSDESRIASLIIMSPHFGGPGHLLRGRRNVLCHALEHSGSLTGLLMERNPQLAQSLLLPGNHHRPDTTFAESCDAVLFHGFGRTDGGDDDERPDSPPPGGGGRAAAREATVVNAIARDLVPASGHQ